VLTGGAALAGERNLAAGTFPTNRWLRYTFSYLTEDATMDQGTRVDECWDAAMLASRAQHAAKLVMANSDLMTMMRLDG